MFQDQLLALIATSIVLPPGPSIILLSLALLFRHPGTRRVFLALGLVSLYVSSIPASADWLRGWLETSPPVSLEHSAAEAIVVLGADRRHGAMEYGGDTIVGLGLERLRYAAWLQKKTGLPVLASGGPAEGEAVPEAELMRGILKEFGVEVAWMEKESRNTYENGLFSSRLLKGVGIGEVLLVTHAWHMPRAREAFERAGLRVIPAPTGAMAPGHVMDFRDWLPSASALRMSYLALHELLGRCWYRYRYYGQSG